MIFHIFFSHRWIAVHNILYHVFINKIFNIHSNKNTFLLYFISNICNFLVFFIINTIRVYFKFKQYSTLSRIKIVKLYYKISPHLLYDLRNALYVSHARYQYICSLLWNPFLHCVILFCYFLWLDINVETNYQIWFTTSAYLYLIFCCFFRFYYSFASLFLLFWRCLRMECN